LLKVLALFINKYIFLGVYQERKEIYVPIYNSGLLRVWIPYRSCTCEVTDRCSYSCGFRLSSGTLLQVESHTWTGALGAE
jgi:hypothetical protein